MSSSLWTPCRRTRLTSRSATTQTPCPAHAGRRAWLHAIAPPAAATSAGNFSTAMKDGARDRRRSVPVSVRLPADRGPARVMAARRGVTCSPGSAHVTSRAARPGDHYCGLRRRGISLPCSGRRTGACGGRTPVRVAARMIQLDASEVVRYATTAWACAWAAAGARHNRPAPGSGAAVAVLAVVLAASAGCTTADPPRRCDATSRPPGVCRFSRTTSTRSAGAAVGSGDQDRIWPWLWGGLRHGRPYRDQRARGRHRDLVPGCPGRFDEPAAGPAHRQLPAGRPCRDPGHRSGAPGAR